jgi:TolB-like protein/tetratricopeptide (TPR) repeat protein
MPPVSAAPRRSGAGRWIAVAGVVLVVAAAAWWKLAPFSGSPESASTPAVENPLIVVFPFENLGASDDEYFAAGVADEITTRLAGVEGLRVLSRSSAMQYDRTGKTPPQIGSDLGVDYVLEGAVRWQRSTDGASRVRVTPQLVGTDAGVQLWAESFDRSMEEIFDVQTEIADAVVDRLGLALRGREEPVDDAAPPTDDLDAYHLYLRATTVIARTGTLDSDQMETSISLLENAVARDPDFAEAWGQLARAHASMVHFGWDQSPERIEASRRAMERGMELDPESPVVQRGRGFYFYHGLKQYEPALRAFKRSIALLPGDVETMVSIGYVLRRQDKMEEAEQWFRRALELSPNDESVMYDLGETLVLLRRYGDAKEYVTRAWRRSPDESRLCQIVSNLMVLMGEVDGAQRILDEYPGVQSDFLDLERFRVAIVRRDFEAALSVAESFPETYRSQFFVTGRQPLRALALFCMGERERATEAVGQALEVYAGMDRETPEHANIVSARAFTRALLGQAEAEDAVGDARRALSLYPAAQDPWIRSFRARDLAFVLARANRPDEAVAELHELLGQDTSAVSVEWLKRTPLFDSLRGRSDFEALLKD